MVSRWGTKQVSLSMVNILVMIISYEYIPHNICSSMIRVFIDE